MRYNRQIMNLFKGSLVVAAFLASPVVATAQRVTNVDANQEGKAIAVTYDLNEKANISLFVTQDGGKTKTAIPIMYNSGDVGKKVAPGADKKILWRVLDQFPNQDFRGENMSFIVKGKPSLRFFAMLNAGYSIDSGFNTGFTIGQLGFIGWYAKAMTTLCMPKPADFECEEGGYVDGWIRPAYSGEYIEFKAYGVAGLTIRLGIPLYLNAGIGYGARICELETTDGKWIKYKPGSYNGRAIDAGIMWKLNSIILSVGATFMYNSSDVCGGLGFVF